MVPLLFVEDDGSFRAAVSQFLSIYFEVTSVDSLKSARRVLKQKPWGIVLLDQKLPDGSGLDLIAALKQHDPSIPILVLTGDSDFGMATKALGIGADDYVIKSAHVIQELLIRIPRVRERRHLINRLARKVQEDNLPQKPEDFSPSSFQDYLDNAERKYLQAALLACGSAEKLANRIGLGRSTVFKKLNDLGVSAKEVTK